MPLADIFKKKLRPSSTSSPTSVNNNASSPNKSVQSPSKADHRAQKKKRSVQLSDVELLFQDQDHLDDDDDAFFRHSLSNSALAVCLRDVLNNPGNGAIAYFVQYLEARDANNLLKFWLDIEGFKGSSGTFPSSNDLIPPSNTLIDPSDFDASEDSHLHFPELSQSPDIPEKSGNSCYDVEAESQSDTTVANATNTSSIQVHEKRTKRSCDNLAKDALEIYQRYIAPDCPYPVPLNREIREGIIQGICTESGKLDLSCFDRAQDFIVETLEKDYFPDFLQSEGYAKHQLDVLTSGEVKMGDILGNEGLLFRFMEFMEGEGERDLLEFWLAACNFRKSQDNTHLQEDALVIYNRFISVEGESCLGLSDSMRSQIEEAICSESGVQKTCFDPVLSLIARLLHLKYLSAFISSPLFRKFVSELLCQIQTGPFAVRNGARDSASSSSHGGVRKKSSRGRLKRSESNTSLSTCSSSEISISTQNTLLASMSRSRSDVLRRNNSSFEDNPDNLWKRKRHSMFHIGQVDNLGRYRSHFERLPPTVSYAHSTTTKLGKAVKRLVSGDGYRGEAQEELAWRMAEMTVKDVLKLTMRNYIATHEEGEDEHEDNFFSLKEAQTRPST